MWCIASVFSSWEYYSNHGQNLHDFFSSRFSDICRSDTGKYDLAFILTVLLYRCYELYTIDDENKIDWLDSTILKKSLTAALTLFLFFGTNFSIAFWICFWISLPQVTRLCPFDWFVLVRAPFTEFYIDVYIYEFHSPRVRITVIMIRCLALVQTNWHQKCMSHR